jgi:predicted PurR-regulated permease PerM
VMTCIYHLLFLALSSFISCIGRPTNKEIYSQIEELVTTMLHVPHSWKEDNDDLVHLVQLIIKVHGPGWDKILHEIRPSISCSANVSLPIPTRTLHNFFLLLFKIYVFLLGYG